MRFENNVLQIDCIKKLYTTGRGLHDMTALIRGGDVLAIIGPNGSGKSTAISMIAGISKGESGQVLLNENSTFNPEIKRNIGYLPEENYLYGGMSILDALLMIKEVKLGGKPYRSVLRSLRKNDKDKYCGREIETLLNGFDLWKFRHSAIETLSMGMARKVCIITAFLGFPPLIILDEPTNGLDTKSVILLKQLISTHAGQGGIIVLASHMLDFIEKVSTKNIFLKDGYVVDTNTDSAHLEETYSRLYLDTSFAVIDELVQNL